MRQAQIIPIVAVGMLLGWNGLPASAAAQTSARQRLAVPIYRDTTGFLAPVRSAISRRIRSHDGTVGVAVLDLTTGDRWGVRAEESFPSASLIKVPIMAEVFERVAEGTLALTDPLTVLNIDRTGGSGVLQHLNLPLEITVWDATYLMGALSDNVATNVLLAKLGPRAVTERMHSYGLSNTRMYVRVNAEPEESFDPDSCRAYGLGVTTPDEMVTLFERLYRGQVVELEASAQILWILSYETTRTGIPRHLPYEIRVAHKTGSREMNRNDCGIVFGQERPFVLCVMTKDNRDMRWTFDNEAESLIADLALLVYEELNP
jgi:beta-lactamase class A